MKICRRTYSFEESRISGGKLYTIEITTDDENLYEATKNYAESIIRVRASLCDIQEERSTEEQ